MTLRQRLIRKASTLALFMAALYAVTLLALLLFVSRVSPTVVLACLGVLVVVSLAGVYPYFRCPRCNASLGALIGHFGPMRRLGKDVSHCPFCGVPFDEPDR